MWCCCCSLQALLVGAVAIAAIAYFTASTFPESANNRGMKVISSQFMNAIDFISQVGGVLGYSSVNISRRLLDSQTVFMYKSDHVEEYTTTMDGIEVTIFKPKGSSSGLRPGIIHYHGGGWYSLSPGLLLSLTNVKMAGSMPKAIYAPVCQALVEETQSIVMSVNYRRSPEHVFPAAIEDCLKATKYFLKNAAEYGVNKVGIKGDSAGGNLVVAATLSLAKEADPNLPTIKFMSPDYPALQAFDFNLPSYIQHEHGPGCLRKDNMLRFWLLYAFGNIDHFDDFYVNNHTSAKLKQQFSHRVDASLLPVKFRQERNDKTFAVTENAELAQKTEKLLMDPLFAPLMASDEDLKLLPPTYVMTPEFDVLRDEGFILVERLRRVGVTVEHTYLGGEMHAFLNDVQIDENCKEEYVTFGKFFKKLYMINPFLNICASVLSNEHVKEPEDM